MTLPTGASGTALQFGDTPNHVLINQAGHGYTFVNGKTYVFGFWARTTSGTRSIDLALTDNVNAGTVTATHALTTDWQWVTVEKSYSSVGANPRAFYCNSISGGDFQVYGAVIYEKSAVLAQESFVSPQSTSFTYDDDGNLTADERWSYTYDAENRLAGLRTLASAVGAAPLCMRATTAGRTRSARRRWWMRSSSTTAGARCRSSMRRPWC